MVPEQPYDVFLGLCHSLRGLFSDDPQELTRRQQTSPEAAEQKAAKAAEKLAAEQAAALGTTE